MSLVAGDAVGGSTNTTSRGSTNATPIGSTNGTPVGGSTNVQVEGDANAPVTRLPSCLTTLTISNGVLCPHKDVLPVIYKTFKKIKNPTGYCWNLTPNPVKKSYWEEFKKVFTWDPVLDDTVYELWHAKARGRMSEPDGPGTGQVRHRGGSKSCFQYAEELASERGVGTKDCLYDVFQYMHKMEDGSYTDVKSARIAKEIEELAEELRQPLPGTTEAREVDMNEQVLLREHKRVGQ